MTDEECQYCGSEFSECTCFQTGPGVEACKEAAEKNKLEPAAWIEKGCPSNVVNANLNDKPSLNNWDALFAAEDIIQFLRDLQHNDGTSNFGDAALENAAQKIQEQISSEEVL